jgi:hypothetical protein
MSDAARLETARLVVRQPGPHDLGAYVEVTRSGDPMQIWRARPA